MLFKSCAMRRSARAQFSAAVATLPARVVAGSSCRRLTAACACARDPASAARTVRSAIICTRPNQSVSRDRDGEESVEWKRRSADSAITVIGPVQVSIFWVVRSKYTQYTGIHALAGGPRGVLPDLPVTLLRPLPHARNACVCAGGNIATC